MNQRRRLRGKQGENKALNYLLELGHSVISRNFRTPYGEIDIISKKSDCIYFIEVKTRKNDVKGKPYESVNPAKLNHMKMAAQRFLLQNSYKDYKLKLAVISILMDINRIDFWDDIEF